MSSSRTGRICRAHWRATKARAHVWMVVDAVHLGQIVETANDVVATLDSLRDAFDVVEYGRLNYDDGAIDHPLFAVRTQNWDADKPSVLVTGGVHGYETRCVSSIQSQNLSGNT